MDENVEDKAESDIRYIRAVAELFTETKLAELSVRRDFGGSAGKLSLRLSRTAPPSPTPAPAPPPLDPGAARSPAPRAPSPSPEPAPETGDTVTSPMVGTAYLGPEPGAEPFVKPGDPVEKGATLLIVEAMKTMNFIDAPRAATVRQVLVDDAEPVEYGTPLVVLD